MNNAFTYDFNEDIKKQTKNNPNITATMCAYKLNIARSIAYIYIFKTFSHCI